MNRDKILLIHGWNYKNYTTTGCVDAWAERSKFTKALDENFNVITLNLPGFCGQKDPNYPWTLDDFVGYVDKVIKKEKPDYLLGYSFGGAIALRWKKLSKDSCVKTFLVSPAIIRRYTTRDLTFFQKTFKSILPKWIVAIFRYFYLTRIIKNPYYAQATPIMKETYLNIVSVDLRQDLLDIEDSLILIYGENDSATPPELTRSYLKSSATKHKLFTIAYGGHDIANTHTNELISLILKGKAVKNENESADYKPDSSKC